MEYRGYDSAGIAVLEGKKIHVRKGVGKVAEVNNMLGMDELPGYVAVGHTRWATHGGVTEKNAHPHLSGSGKLALVHNGIVDNYQVLKDSLLKEGFSFRSVIDSEGISIFDFEGNPVPHSVTRVAEEFGVIGKGKYVHFTLKEIFEQPQTITIAAKLTESELKEVSRLLTEASGVYVMGCGTSYHAALLGCRLLSEYTQVNATPVLASEAKFFPAKYDSKTVLIALSQSGETADVLEAVEIGREKGAKVVSIVNVATSTLARISTLSIGLRCGPEIGVAATKSFTSQLATFYAIASHLSGGRVPSDLGGVSKGISELLLKQAHLREVARRMRGASDIYVLGTGPHYCVALEGALKIKELAYVHAEALPGGELKHGPLALLDPSVYVIVVNPSDATYVDMLASAHEAKSRGAKIIGISDKPSDVYDEWLGIPKLDPTLSPLVEVVPFQALAYYLAVERNADPDYPRNLAKSVTVK